MSEDCPLELIAFFDPSVEYLKVNKNNKDTDICLKFKEKPEIVVISATIFVERDTQKAIILGHKGESIKKLGTLARKDIEAFIEKKVYLELSLKVSSDWREDANQLKRFGYEF